MLTFELRQGDGRQYRLLGGPYDGERIAFPAGHNYICLPYHDMGKWCQALYRAAGDGCAVLEVALWR